MVFPTVIPHPSLLADGLGALGLCGWGHSGQGNPQWLGMGTPGQGQQGGGDTGAVHGPRRAAQNYRADEDNEK